MEVQYPDPFQFRSPESPVGLIQLGAKAMTQRDRFQFLSDRQLLLSSVKSFLTVFVLYYSMALSLFDLASFCFSSNLFFAF
jgi:hypothetical protein